MHSEALLPRGAPILELGASTNPQLPTVVHLPVGTCGPQGAEAQRHARHARSLLEAPSLGPGWNVIGVGFHAEVPDVVRDPQALGVPLETLL